MTRLSEHMQKAVDKAIVRRGMEESDPGDLTLRVEVTPEKQFWSDLMVTAFDGQYGGCWYWATPANDNWLHTEAMVAGHDVENLWTATDIKLKEPLGDPLMDQMFNDGYRVTWHTLCWGFKYALRGTDAYGQPAGYSDLQKAMLQQDPGEVDADAIDVLVQMGVFGQVIFG